MTRQDCYVPDPTFINGCNRAITNLNGQPGTFLEFGVYGGRTFEYLAIQILDKSPQSKLYGFDSWKGLPKETLGVWFPERHSKGKMATPACAVVRKLSELNIKVGQDDRFHLISGFFCNSLTHKLQATINNLIFVNVDVDIHSSTIELLEFITPLVQIGTVIFLDNWADPNDCKIRNDKWGEHLAFEQWLEKNPSIKVSEHDINFLNQRWFEVEKI